MTTNYKRGYAAERRYKAKLEKEGYFVVRSGGSKGPVDLIAVSKDFVLFVQVKSGPDRAREALITEFQDELEVVGELANKYYVKPEFVYWNTTTKEFIIL